MGGFLLPSLGMEVVYSRGADRLAAEFQEIQPAVVTAVPRLFEVLRARIAGAASRRRAACKRDAVPTAPSRSGCGRWTARRSGLLDRLQDAVLDRLVREKVRARFGGRLQALVSGGARLDPDLSGFFLALGLPVIQGYGQTEAGPVISVNLPWDNRPPAPSARRCRAWRRASPRMASCWCAATLVMDGYWNNAEATAAALRIRGRSGRLAAHRRRRRHRRTAASASPTASGTSSRRSAATWSAPPRSKAC